MSVAAGERSSSSAGRAPVPVQLGLLFAAGGPTSAPAAPADVAEALASRPALPASYVGSAVRVLVERPAAAGRTRGRLWVERWTVASATNDQVVYVVARSCDGTMGCSCKGWTLHASRPQCRHIRAVLEGGQAHGS